MLALNVHSIMYYYTYYNYNIKILNNKIIGAYWHSCSGYNKKKWFDRHTKKQQQNEICTSGD